MKNLKKALSLVLASAMLVGMMVVGTGAVHSDVKAEHNVEAIAVVSALEIMGAGDTFNPDGEITRGEMAVIMTKMLALDTKEFKGASKFVDAGWAADYIDACYANGIMAGVSATEFGTNVKLTTAQAALMMLKALGYYEVATLPANWDLAVVEIIRAASADESNVLEGIDAKAYGNMTRNEVAKMILNTLYIPMVEESLKAGSTASTTVKGEGFEVIIGGNQEIETKTLETLLVDEFDIKSEDDATVLGLPATTWSIYDEDEEEYVEIITVADAVKAVAVYEDQDDALDLYKEKVDKKFKKAVTLKNAEALVEGDEVHFIKNGDNYDAYVVRYELEKIESVKVTTKKDKTTTKVNGVEVAKGVEVDVEKGDWALIAVANGKIGAIKDAEIVEGKVTAVKAGKYTIAGDKYEAVEGIKLTVGSEVEVALNAAGKIEEILKAEDVKSDDFAYIYNVVKNTEDGEKNEDGFVADDEISYTAYVILADGTKAKYAMAEELDDDDNAIDLTKYNKKFVAYSINKDDEFEVVSAEAYTTVEKTVKLDKDNKSISVKVLDEDENEKTIKAYADSKTEFVFISSKNDEGKVWTATTNTGVKNVEVNAPAFVIYNDDQIETVFVLAKDEGLTVDPDTKYAILIDDEAEVTEGDEDDEYVYTYAVYADGEETVLSFYNEELKGVKENAVFAYEMDDEYATVKDVKNELKTMTVAYIGEDFIEMTDGKEFTLADDAEIYGVVEAEDEDDETKIVYEYEEGELEEDMTVQALVNDDDEIVLAFFYEALEADEE